MHNNSSRLTADPGAIHGNADADDFHGRSIGPFSSSFGEADGGSQNAQWFVGSKCCSRNEQLRPEES